MGQRFYELEDWFDAWRWYHWLLLLAALWGVGFVGTKMGWIEEAPSGGWQHKAATEAPAPVQR